LEELRTNLREYVPFVEDDVVLSEYIHKAIRFLS